MIQLVSHMRTGTWALLLLAASAAANDGQHFRLVVLHNNDMHARFEQTNAQSGRCAQKHISTNDCYGGFARVATFVKQVKAKEPNVVFLNAGDTYQGTTWYTVHKWRVVAHFMQMIGMDAMSLGNHEFDDGVEGLAPFIQNVSIPVLAANLNISQEPSLRKLRPSVILNVGSKKVGVIGYLTPETQELVSSTGKVIFEDEVPAVRREVERLRSSGVNILIAVGHSGHSMDKKIAQEVDGIDLVIGGHTNTFLYSGDQPDSDIPVDLYPTMVIQDNGRKVPVVQAYAYTKYMGRLDLTFDSNGEIVDLKGNPILLDRNVPQDAAVLQELKPWADDVLKLTTENVGKTIVYLNGSQSSCRMRECNIGNLITDAFVQYYAQTYSGPGWTDAPIALQNGGGIRNSIDESTASGSVTMEDILSVLPFQTGVIFMKIRGEHLLQALEESVRFYDLSGIEAPGRFLQYSGLQVNYDLLKPPGSRVVSASTRCGESRVPHYHPLKRDEVYGVIISQYVADGGDGYHVFSQRGYDRKILDAQESDILADYFQRKSPVWAGIEGRIIFLNEIGDSGTVTNTSPLSLPLLALFSVVVFMGQ